MSTQHKKIKFELRDLDVTNICFATEGDFQQPRFHTLFGFDEFKNKNLAQEKALDQLLKSKKVVQIVESIRNGMPILYPIIVKKIGNTEKFTQELDSHPQYIVIGGNGRLAACKYLRSQGSVDCTTIPCAIITEDTTNDEILKMLAQQMCGRIASQKKWGPYDIAKYIYRRREKGISYTQLNEELPSLDQSTIKHYLTGYKMMRESEEKNQRKFSYYLQICKNFGKD